MILKNSKKVIFIFIAVFIYVYYLTSTKTYTHVEVNMYERLQVNDTINDQIDKRSFLEYNLDFFKVILPDFIVSYDNSRETKELNGIVISDYISLKGGTSITYLVRFNPEEYNINDINISNYNGNGIHTYSSFQKDFLLYVQPLVQDAYYDDSSKKIYYFYDVDGNTCFIGVLNETFSLNIDNYYYCPSKTEFFSKEEQMANYIFDSFMALDIPNEFSEEYLVSQNRK